jgi:hypothetical protein
MLKHRSAAGGVIDSGADNSIQVVMAGLVPAIHALGMLTVAWVPGTRPGMTEKVQT